MVKKSKKSQSSVEVVDAEPTLDEREKEMEQQEPEESEELENPLRVIMIVNSPDVPEGDMQERSMDYVQTLKEVDDFFNQFDETIAIPNESHIKYEVGSDGLVLIVVDSLDVRDKALKFIDDYNDKLGIDGEDEPASKKKK